jgi:hypothetical protein
VVLKEFMIQRLYKKELSNAKLTHQQLKITLNALNTEHSHMVVEVLVLKELLCFIVHLRTLETLHYSLEILKESHLDL